MIIETKNAKVTYDYANDIFYAIMSKRNYKHSIDLGNFIFDLDKDDNIVGIEILGASKIFNVPKLVLQNMKKLEIRIEAFSEMIRTYASIEGTFRNSARTTNINFEQIIDNPADHFGEGMTLKMTT